MGEAAHQRFTVEQFIDWVRGRPGRWELVEGQPVRMMAGAKGRHNKITANALRVLGNQLLDGPCFALPPDAGVLTAADRIRQPDVVVDCAPDDDEMPAGDPRVVIEVLSDSTRAFDTTDKLAEYQATDGLMAIVLVNARHVWVRFYERGVGGWTSRRFTSLDDVIAFDDPRTELPLHELYRGVSLDPFPPLTIVPE